MTKPEFFILRNSINDCIESLHCCYGCLTEENKNDLYISYSTTVKKENEAKQLFAD